MYSEEWGDALQQDHDEYMESLYESVDTDGDAVDATGALFCGCDVCERRASWSFLLERAIRAYRDGSLQLEA